MAVAVRLATSEGDAVSARLGFSTRTESLTMEAGLPLTGLP
jgi:hypothetical protein